MNLDAKVNALIAKSNPVPGADSAPDKEAGAPPDGQRSGTESAPGAPVSVAASSPAAPGEATPGAPTTMADVFAAKLAEVTERSKAARIIKQAKARAAEADRLAAEAKADRDAAAATKAELAEGRKDFQKFLKANGMSPAEAYQEMTRQALEADTPEAKLKAAQEAWKAELADTVEPLKKTIADLTEREEAAQKQAAERAFRSDFDGAVSDSKYESLLDEYPEERLLAHAKAFRDNPSFFFEQAELHDVSLTTPGKGFTMQDILNVLKSVQDAHEAGRQTRRAARTATAPSGAAQSAAQSPTVNGTAERPNAGQVTTIGNDLATERAADGKFIPKGTTAAQRIRERARRLATGR